MLLRTVLLIALAGFSTSLPAEDGKLNPASIRAFVAAENRAWNARDFARFYGAFAPGARITTISAEPNGRVRRAAHSVSEDRKQTERFFATSRAIIRETDAIQSVEVSPDGGRAHVHIAEDVGIVENGKPRQLHAIVEEELELQNGRILVLELKERR